MYGKPGAVLILEDDVSMADLLSRLVTTLWPDPDGARPVVAPSLAMATTLLVAAYPDHLPDLVLVDLHLPDSVGVATIDALVPLLLADTPLVVISGTVTPLEGVLTVRHGATAFLLKDAQCTPALLLDTLSNAWARAQGTAFRRLRAKPAWPAPDPGAPGAL